MLNYLSDLIPKFIRLNKKLDDITVLTNKHWIEFREDGRKVTLIFSQNPKIIRTSENGIIVKGSWEYLGNNKIEIELNGEANLYQHRFHDDKILLLNLDGTEKFTLFIQETEYVLFLNNYQKITNYIDKISSNFSSGSKSVSSLLKIKDENSFNEIDYPEIKSEIDVLKVRLKEYTSKYQVEILIHFLQNNSLKKEWVQINPIFCHDLVNNMLPINHISIFVQLCSNNSKLLELFMNYFTAEIRNSR